MINLVHKGQQLIKTMTNQFLYIILYSIETKSRYYSPISWKHWKEQEYQEKFAFFGTQEKGKRETRREYDVSNVLYKPVGHKEFINKSELVNGLYAFSRSTFKN